MTLQIGRSYAPARPRRALIAITWTALCLSLLPAYVLAQTSAIPLSTLPTAPTAGTLPNGVNFSVNRGAPHPTQGYILYPAISPQIWTFDQPVSLRFGLRGLNFQSECFRVPVGTVAEFIHPQHNWNPGTRMLCRTAAATDTAQSTFTLAGPVTQLVLEAINTASGGRGPGLIEVTVDVGIALDKSATAPTPLIAGSIVNYSFLVTNTGDVGLSAVTVTDPLPGLSPISCATTTLAGGASMTCTAIYQVTPADVVAGVINNTATATGTPATATGSVTAQDSVTVSPTQLPDIELEKNASGPDPLIAGATVNYALVVTNSGNVPLTNVTVTDPLPGLSPIACPGTTLNPGANMTCTASYVITPADVTAGVLTNTATVQGTPPVGPAASAQDSASMPPAQLPSIVIEKTGNGPDPLTAGATVSYGFLIINTGNVPLTNVTVTDPLPGLSPIACPSTALNAGANMTCTATYQITPADVAAGVIDNTATAQGTPPSGPPVSAQGSASVPPLQSPAIALDKSGSGPDPLTIGATVIYQFLVTNTGDVPLTNVAVIDPLPGLSPVACPNTELDSGANMTCTATYQITSADVAAGVINNTATAQGTPPSGPPVSAQGSASVPPLQSPAIALDKSGSGPDPLTVGATVTYQFLVTNSGNVPLTSVTITDPLLGLSPIACPGTTLNPGANMTCTATYVVTEADVAAGFIDNTATVQGAPPSGPAVSAQDSARLTPAQPIVETSKSSDRGNGVEVRIGDTITYTVRATITGGALGQPLMLTDTLGSGLRFSSVTVPGAFAADATGAPTLLFTLPAGTPAGSYSVSYTATVDESASDFVSNTVAASVGACSSCTTTNTVFVEPEVRLVKTVAVRTVRVGDLVRYTLTLGNIGGVALVNGTIIDTPAPGFSFIEGSLQIADGDDQASVQAGSPLRFSGVDVQVGASATLTYLMRVGAGVRPGVHANHAQALSPRSGEPISAVATAQVELVADPLIDDSLIFGTVFDDRDRDGWQDSAALSEVRIRGGFAPDAYIASSTTVDRGAGHEPVRDASAPLLHGFPIGTIAPRRSEADPSHTVIIRQRLREPAFTDDFVLTSAQGVTVRMNAVGRIVVEKHGEAAKGLNAAAPRVERHVAHDEQGYVVDYIVRNDGIDERGIPGVRIASVEGLLIETDQFGRFHLVGVSGGPAERGRNFVLKVDSATLPPGAELTTDNTRVRRVTPGLPVRFDWGVALPTQRLQRSETVELELGEVIFAPGSAVVRERYVPVLERVAAKVREHGGGEVVIDANAGTEALALARAVAVKQALLGLLDEAVSRNLAISVRGKIEDPDSLLVSLGAGGTQLGTVLFDTDASVIRPEFDTLLDRIAAMLEEADGGTVLIVGHTDVRASYEYNAALGLRRAKAVYEALAKRLSAAVRAKVRVESDADPASPIDATRQ